MTATEVQNGRPRPGGGQGLRAFIPFLMLAVVSLLTYANAWPDMLVLDDKFFAASDKYSSLADIPRFFSEDVWAVKGGHSHLYRPLLLTSFALDYQLFGDWFAGYHLSNILFHLLVSVMVYGLLRQMLWMSEGRSSGSELFALLAALIFAVHPIHTEVVNSIFNRSGLLVSLAGAGGLWWLLHYLNSRPALAWTGLAFAYLFAMLSKEGGVILPGLAVALILMLTPGGLWVRIRRSLPVFWLLIPLALYLVLRAHALAPPELAAAAGPAGVAEVSTMVKGTVLPGLDTLSRVSRVWGESLKVLVWPYPLQLYYHQPLMSLWISLALQLALVLTAFIRFRRGHAGLAVGLAVFYIAILPASRIIHFGDVGPHINERYLYFPSLGLVVALAFGFRALGKRFGTKSLVLPGLLVLMSLAAITWDRNADWASEILLFETEYNQGDRGHNTLGLLTEAHLAEGNIRRVIRICDRHTDKQERFGNFNFHCGVAYRGAKLFEEAERSFLLALNSERNRSKSHSNLGQIYVWMQRRDDAIRHFELAVETQKDPAIKAFRKGDMLLVLYPRDRARLLEARDHFREALRLQPQWRSVQQQLKQLDMMLDSTQ